MKCKKCGISMSYIRIVKHGLVQLIFQCPCCFKKESITKKPLNI